MGSRKRCIANHHQVREFHNGIKLRALRRIWDERPVTTIGTPVLLVRIFLRRLRVMQQDLGCGCANDVHKWNSIGIENVVGVDPDWEQITKGIERVQVDCSG